MTHGETGRILGIDPGERRVGLAVSDPLGVIATGLPTFDRREDGDLFERLRELVESYGVIRVVVGHPKSLAGRSTSATVDAETLAGEIRRRFPVEVEMWDERLSSAEAERVLAGTRPDKKRIDRLAAVIILQGYLDAHPRPPL